MHRRVKYIVLFVFLILGVFLFKLIAPIRTESVMKELAEEELNCTLEEFYKGAHVKGRLQGPIVRHINNGLCFQWFVPLEWGDSASFYIDVFKSPMQVGWRKFLFRNTRMNYQTSYLQFPDGRSHFVDVLPHKWNSDTTLLSRLFLASVDSVTSSSSADVYHPFVSQETLFLFLQKGFFTVVERKPDYSVVEFFQPIGWKQRLGERKTDDYTDKISTERARVMIDDDYSVRIVPVDRPV